MFRLQLEVPVPTKPNATYGALVTILISHTAGTLYLSFLQLVSAMPIIAAINNSFFIALPILNYPAFVLSNTFVAVVSSGAVIVWSVAAYVNKFFSVNGV